MSSDCAERLLCGCYERLPLTEPSGPVQTRVVDRFRSGPLTFPVRDVPPAKDAPGSGETVILLHGFPQTAASWDELTPKLTAAGYRVLAPDQRGYAPGALAKRRRDYRQTELVSDIIALIDAADLERVHLVGHDWGGAVAWGLAASHPERLLSMTTLSTPHPRAMLRAMVTGTQLRRSWYMLAFQLPGLPERALDPSKPGSRAKFIATLRSSGLPAAEAELAADALAVPGVTTGALNWYRGLPFSVGSVGNVTDVPVLYVWGRNDKFLGRKAAELTARYVSAPYSFREIDAGHWLQAQAAEPLLAHLAEHPAG